MMDLYSKSATASSHIMFLLLSLLLTATPASTQTTDIVVFDGDCGTLPTDTCSPDNCQLSTTVESCDMGPERPLDWADQVASMECKQCEQSTQSKCGNIASIVKTDAGVKAAYCNDKYLVIWAEGTPRYDPTLDTLPVVPNPPKGMRAEDDECFIRTALGASYPKSVLSLHCDLQPT